jgi:hypothetical protein
LREKSKEQGEGNENGVFAYERHIIKGGSSCPLQIFETAFRVGSQENRLF